MFKTPRCYETQRNAYGFTIVELMVALAILAVLASLAAPSLSPLIERWRVRQASEELQGSLQFARSEAIKRGGNITMSKLATSGDCTSSSNSKWDCGWTVSTNGGSLQQALAPEGVQITLTSSSGTINFDRWGMLSHGGGANTSTAMDFLLTPRGKDANANGSIRLCTGLGGLIIAKKGNESCS